MKKKGNLGLYYMSICIFSGSRRESDDPQQFEFVAEEEETGKQAAMTEDYNWYYRTEDCKCYCDKNNSLK